MEVQVIFIGDYKRLFKNNEQEEKRDSEYGFELAIRKIIKETGATPIKGDWIDPIDKSEYPLDIGLVAHVDTRPSENRIQFKIE